MQLNRYGITSKNICCFAGNIWLNRLIDKFTEFRTAENFKPVLLEASKVAHELKVETDFPTIDTIRPRKKPTQFQYEHSGEVLV
ncbi:unnamed protein product [Euphydryas editha]|uniref:Uncharacterized protein n=1 Tax=Euphydryas editha TaxID=104508 RepID=A0AAU9USM3_EUPED|nr:unnamed protein product [Euphydryas editha]